MIDQKSKIKNQNFKLKFKTFYFLIVLFTFNFLLFTFPASAHDDGIGESRLTPASPLYFLKSVREVLELKLAGTTRTRALRELEFSTRRVREIKGLAHNRQDLIEPTVYKYLSHLREFIGIADLQESDFASKVSKEISGQILAFQTVYTEIQDKRALMSVRAVLNAVSEQDLRLIDKLKLAKRIGPANELVASHLSVCRFLQKEASSSALNEVEKTVLGERAKTCFLKSQPVLPGPGV